MKRTKRLTRAIARTGIAITALVAAGIAILNTRDFDPYGRIISERIEAATGRRLTIDGEIGLELSLTSRVVVHNVAFGNAGWGSAPDMVRLGRLAAVVELMPLFSGEIRVRRLELTDVDVMLETDANGAGNWLFEASPESASDEHTGRPNDPLLVVRMVHMRNVALQYRDRMSGAVRVLAFDNLNLATNGYDMPLNLSGVLNVHGETIDMVGSSGSFQAW